MKIAHLISEYLPGIGGAQVCIHNVALELVKNGDKVVVVTTTQDRSSKNYGYPVIRISRWFQRVLRFSWGKYFLWHKLNSLQKKHCFDLWQVTVGYPLGAYAVPFFRSKNIPCVLRCCGEDIQIDESLQYGCRLSPSVDILVRDTYPKYDALIALTESVMEEYKKIGIPDEKISLIPNGIELERFSKNKSKEQLKEKLGFKNKTVLLTAGRNHPKKGYGLIPQIMERIYSERKDIVWVVIGKGCGALCSNVSYEFREYLLFLEEVNSETHDFPKRLPPDELLDYYHSADLFVFPSFIETFGMVLIEAMAAGLPVVTSNVPGCRDVIKDGYNGLLAEAGNTEMFAKKILTLLNNKELYQQMVLNIESFIKEYDWQIIAQKYRELYKKVLENPAMQ